MLFQMGDPFAAATTTGITVNRDFPGAGMFFRGDVSAGISRMDLCYRRK
jgi:hypothetical protein